MVQVAILILDQEPCTALFIEVVDVEHNNGREEVHCIRNPSTYSKTNPSSFSTIPISKLRLEVERDSAVTHQLLKVYCKNNRTDQSR
jgi:mitofusin